MTIPQLRREAKDLRDFANRFLLYGENPTEYSVQPMGDVPTGPQSLSSLRPNLNLANEIRRCPRVQGSKGAQFGHKFQRTKERQRVGWWNRTFLGSPAFVAVVQATDLR
jgi:hypothetical protein